MWADLVLYYYSEALTLSGLEQASGDGKQEWHDM